MTDAITDLLLRVMAISRWPVLIGLLLLAASSLHQLGGFIVELSARRRRCSLEGGPPALLTRAMAECGLAASPIQSWPRLSKDHVQVLLDRIQLESEAALTPLSLGIRLGPSLGLIGTLVPLGPALGALGEGRVAELSDELVVAFGTTVLGMLSSSLCFLIHAVRSRWLESDLAGMEAMLLRRQER